MVHCHTVHLHNYLHLGSVTAVRAHRIPYVPQVPTVVVTAASVSPEEVQVSDPTGDEHQHVTGAGSKQLPPSSKTIELTKQPKPFGISVKSTETCVCVCVCVDLGPC